MIQRVGALVVLAFLVCGAAFGAPARELVKNGLQYYRDGEYDEAVGAFSKAQGKTEESAEIAYDLGLTFFARNKPAPSPGETSDITRAEDLLHTAARRAEHDGNRELQAKALFALGTCLARQGKLEEALEELAKAHEIAPDDPDVTFNLRLIGEALGLLQHASGLMKALSIAALAQAKVLADTWATSPECKGETLEAAGEDGEKSAGSSLAKDPAAAEQHKLRAVRSMVEKMKVPGEKRDLPVLSANQEALIAPTGRMAKEMAGIAESIGKKFSPGKGKGENASQPAAVPPAVPTPPGAPNAAAPVSTVEPEYAAQQAIATRLMRAAELTEEARKAMTAARDALDTRDADSPGRACFTAEPAETLALARLLEALGKLSPPRSKPRPQSDQEDEQQAQQQEQQQAEAKEKDKPEEEKEAQAAKAEESEQQKDKEDKKQASAAKEMSEEEAARWLEEIRQEEKEIRRDAKKRRGFTRQEHTVEKDW